MKKKFTRLKKSDIKEKNKTRKGVI